MSIFFNSISFNHNYSLIKIGGNIVLRYKEKEMELLSPKIDIVFHALFRESNNRLTEAFLTDVLGEKVKIIANLDRYMDIKSAEEKLGVMDLRVELENHTNCNVDIQIKKYKDQCERFLYYLADTYSR